MATTTNEKGDRAAADSEGPGQAALRGRSGYPWHWPPTPAALGLALRVTVAA